MPTYKFKDNNTGKEWEEFMGISAADDYLAENPHIERLPNGFPAFTMKGTGDRIKPPEGFKEVLSKISDANPTSKLADDYGKKDKKSVAVRDSMKRVRKKIGISE